jgi:hypothetical protein
MNMQAIKPESDNGLISTPHDEAGQLERDAEMWSRVDRPANQSPVLDEDGEVVSEPTPFDDWNTEHD